MFKINLVSVLCLLWICDISSAFLLETRLDGDHKVKKKDDEKCLEDISKFIDAISSPEPPQWAIQMLDSSTKLQPGIFAGNLADFGHWDECLSVDAGSFKGQHCLVYVKPDALSKVTRFNRQMINITEQPWMHDLARYNNRGLFDTLEIGLSYCIPSSCRGDGIQKAVKELIEKIGESLPGGLPIKDIPIRFTDDFCNTKETEPLTAVDYSAAAVFAFFGLLLFLSTVYDVYMRYTERKVNNTLWLAFSILHNGEKIFRINPTPTKKTDNISCVQGLRSLSIIWVVYCHRLLMFGTVPAVFNFFDAWAWMTEYRSTIVSGGTLAVDTFLILSGFLLTYMAMKTMSKTGGRIPLFKYYLHRYLRLTPPVAALVLLHCSFFYRLGSGPFWKSEVAKKELRDDCQLYWWAPLLYIQNYYNNDNMCITQSWYLSVDMQLYVIAPLLLIPLYKWTKPTLAFIGVLSLASVGINFAITYVNDFTGGMANPSVGDDPRAQMRVLYFPVHTRFGPWLLGIVLGYIMHKTRDKEIKMSKTFCLSMWAIALAIIPVVVVGGYRFYRFDWENDVMLSSFYQALHRQAWSFTICWLIFACHNGYGGPINWFLSWGVWQPIARLSYCIYLLHYQMQTAETVARKMPMYFNEFDLIASVWSDFGLSFTASLAWSLAFESPITVLEKSIFGGGKPSNIKTEKVEPKEIAKNGDLEKASLDEKKDTTEIIPENKLLGEDNHAYSEKL